MTTRITLGLLLVLAAGCSSSTPSIRPHAAAPTSAATQAAPPTPTPTGLRALSRAQLVAALLPLSQAPVGFSQDPPTPDTPTRTFCDYKQPTLARITVARDFTKGAGLMSVAAHVTLRQYDTADAARQSFVALRRALETCHGETYQGQRFRYVVVNPPNLGEGAVGVSADIGQGALTLFFVLDGPVLVSAGAGGLSADPDLAASLVGKQVAAYEAAATA